MITSRLFPAWRTFDHFTAMVQAAAFGLDALQSTHPIQVPVNHPDEINEIFDVSAASPRHVFASVNACRSLDAMLHPTIDYRYSYRRFRPSHLKSPLTGAATSLPAHCSPAGYLLQQGCECDPDGV